MKMRVTMALGVLAVGVSVIAWKTMLAPRSIAGASSVSGNSSASGDSSGPSGDPLRIACVPSQSHVFTLDYESHGQLLDPALGLPTGGSATQSVEIAVRGRVTETCLESEGGRLSLALRFSGITGEVVIEPGLKQPASGSMVGVSFAELDPSGLVQTIRFAPEMPSMGQNIVRDLLSHRSMKLPTASAVTWQTQEVDMNGPYVAVYRIEKTAEDGVHMVKRRETMPPIGASKPMVRYLDGTRAEIRLQSGWLADLDATTQVEIVNGKKVIARSSTRVVLRGGGREEEKQYGQLRRQLLAARASSAGVGDLEASDADRRLDEKMQREELRDDSWSTLWAKATEAKPDEAKVFLKLRALFKLHPEECKRAAAALADIDAKDKSFMLVASALAATGSPEAQQSLREAIDRSSGKRDNQEVLLAELGSLERPDRATQDFAQKVMRTHADAEVRNTAQLAIGNMARSLAQSDPARAGELVDVALEQARASKSLDESVTAIQTLGNTGSREALDALRAAAASPNFVLRQSAAAAMRFVEGDDVEQMLLALALRDPEPAVRGEAVTSMRSRAIAPASFNALAELIKHDPSESVRQTLVSLLAGNAEQFPDAVAILTWVAQHDPRKDVRGYAEMALLQLRN